MRKPFLIFFLGLFIVIPLVSLASGLVPCGGYKLDANGNIQYDANGNPIKERPCTLCDFFVLFDRIIDFLLIKIVPPLAVLMLVIGGFVYVISGGSPSMVALSRKIFTSVAYGLLIAYGAFLIVGFFFKIIGLSQWTTDIYHNWWQNGFFEIKCK